MRALVAVLMMGVALAGVGPTFAQDAGDAPAVVEKAALVVIAPAKSDVAKVIKSNLQAAYYGAKPGTRAYAQAQKLYYFYGSRGFEPIWLTTGADGKPAFSPNAGKIIDVFKGAELEGLRPSDYLSPDLDPSAAGSDPTPLTGSRPCSACRGSASSLRVR